MQLRQNREMTSKSVNEVPVEKIAAVTGGTGVLGHHLINLLLEQNWKVRVLSRGAKTIDSRVELVPGSLADNSALLRLIEGVDAVFHCAAEIYDVSRMREANVEGTANLLQALDNKKLKYFCHISSAIVVGPVGPILITEETSCHPKSEYEKTKWEGEQLVRQWNGCDRVCILRPADGVDADSLGVLTLGIRNNWIDRLRVFLQGQIYTHIVYIKDVAAAALYFVDHDFSSPGCFFVSCDEDKLNTVAGLYSICRSEISGRETPAPLALPAFIPNILRFLRRGKSLHVHALFSEQKLKNHGFKPSYGLSAGVKDILKQLMATPIK